MTTILQSSQPAVEAAPAQHRPVANAPDATTPHQAVPLTGGRPGVGVLALTRANRRQLLALTLVWVTTDMLDSEDPDTRRAIISLECSRRQCWLHLCPTADPGDYHRGVQVRLDSPKSERQYRRMMSSVADTLRCLLPDESDPALLMNSVLTILERIRDRVPESPADRRHDWDVLVERYADLYALFDPECAAPDMDMGEVLGRELMEVVG